MEASALSIAGSSVRIAESWRRALSPSLQFERKAHSSGIEGFIVPICREAGGVNAQGAHFASASAFSININHRSLFSSSCFTAFSRSRLSCMIG